MSYLVVGGGIAGLAAAHALVREQGVPGGEVQILEASGRVGGCLQPVSIAGQVVDAGPDAVLTRRPEAVELIRDLGLENRCVTPATGRAYLASESGLSPYPPGLFLGIPLRRESLREASVLSAEGVRRALEGFELPPTKSAADVTITELVSRRWGIEVAEHLAGPLLAAVHAGKADYLSAAACAPQLFPDARPHSGGDGVGSSPFISLAGGLWQLGEVLRQFLEGRGVSVVTDTPVLALSRSADGWTIATTGRDMEAERLVLAVGAQVAARLVAPITPVAGEALRSIDHASVAIAAVVVSASAQFPEGSGFLVRPDPDSSRVLTACTWFDQKWPDTARPDGRLLRLSAGRHGDSRFEALDDVALAERLVSEAAELMGQTLEIQDAAVSRFARAFPQYAVGHLARVSRIGDEVRRSGSGTLALCGNAYAGVGIPAVIGSARSAARAVAPGA